MDDALSQVIEELAHMFESLADDYARQRVMAMMPDDADFFQMLTSPPAPADGEAQGRWVPAAKQWSSRELDDLDLTHAAALLVEDDETEPTAAMARERGIPAVAVPESFWQDVSTGDTVVVDGTSGRVVVRPDAATLERWRSRQAAGRVRSSSNW